MNNNLAGERGATEPEIRETKGTIHSARATNSKQMNQKAGEPRTTTMATVELITIEVHPNWFAGDESCKPWTSVAGENK